MIADDQVYDLLHSLNKDILSISNIEEFNLSNALYNSYIFYY